MDAKEGYVMLSNLHIISATKTHFQDFLLKESRMEKVKGQREFERRML